MTRQSTPLPSNRPASDTRQPVKEMGKNTPTIPNDQGGTAPDAQHRIVRSGLLSMREDVRTDLIIEMIRMLKPESRGRIFTEFNPTAKLSSRTLASVDHVYVIKMTMAGSEEAALVHVVHEKLFTPQEVEEHAREASKITAETHTAQFAKRLAGQHLQAKIEEINNDAFPRAVTFFEAVLVDRFGYKKMVLNGAMGTIQPTIVVEAPQTPAVEDQAGVKNVQTESTQADDAGNRSA